jgi:hypothetical protein
MPWRKRDPVEQTARMPVVPFEKPPSSDVVASTLPRTPEATVLQFERSELSRFRNLSGLAQSGGVQEANVPRLAFKEIADNAIDAGGSVTFRREAGITWVCNDGQGIVGTDAEIASMFSIGRDRRTSKLWRLPTRGAQGNGLRVAVGFVLCAKGRLRVCTMGRELELRPRDSGETQVVSTKPWGGRGTEVGVGVAPTDGMLEWAEVAKAHVGASTYQGKSSPHWYDASAFYELCQAAPPDLFVRRLVERLDGCTGARAGEIAAAYKNRAARDLTRAEAERLLVVARESAKPVTAKRLGVVGELEAFSGYGKATADDVAIGESRWAVRLPVVVEAWATVDQSSVTLMVNRTVAVGPMFADERQKRIQIFGCHYQGEALPSGGNEYAVEINVQTPYMPIVSDGKEPDLEPFADLLNVAIRQAIGRAKRAAGVLRVSPSERTTRKGSCLAHLDEGVALVSSDGALPFSQRDLFYAVRPFVGREGGELDWGYFVKLIAEHEAEGGKIPGMYRDERGVLILPHTREVVAMGTLSVENFERPEWLFCKLLYVEKAGFFQTLMADNWLERHDCALVTSQGQATGCVKDLIDRMGDHAEPITVFCAHDADAFGTQIYESLQEATLARPARRIEIVNLGLELAEAEAMGLEVEELKPSGKKKPVAAYVSNKDRERYQTQRVELNAMRPEALIAWLDEKMESYEKLVPPKEVMADCRRNEVEKAVELEVIDLLMAREGRRLVVERLATLEAKLVDTKALPYVVKKALEAAPEESWRTIVEREAKQIASSLGGSR